MLVARLDPRHPGIEPGKASLDLLRPNQQKLMINDQIWFSADFKDIHLYNNHLVHAGEGGAGGKSGASTAHLYGQMVLGRVQTTDSNQEETIYEEPLGEQHPFNSTRCIFDCFWHCTHVDNAFQSPFNLSMAPDVTIQ